MPAHGAQKRLAVAAIRDPEKPHRLTIDSEAIGALADDIAANGLLQPPGVVLDDTEEGGELVWGHRRLLAVRALGWDVIECRTFPRGTDPLQARLSENNQREPLTPVEEAHIVGECIARGETPSQVMRRFRRSRAWVEERAAILEWPKDVREAVHEKTLPIGVGHELAAIDNEAYRRELINEAERCGATRAVAALWRAHYETQRPRVVANQLTLDQLRAGRDDYTIRHKCPFCAAETALETTRLYRVCGRCAEVLEAELVGRVGDRASTDPNGGGNATGSLAREPG